MRGWIGAAAVCLIFVPGAAGGQEPPDIRIDLANGSEREARMADELRALLDGYDLEPWILTRHVVIEEGVIPHSHPILTLHTRHLGDELGLLSAFLHEQLHWLEDRRAEEWEAAMADYREIFPEVPSSEDGGARDEASTYRHLLVCDLEYQAMTVLVGEERARQTLSGITHYEWIYDRVLSDPRVREVALRHGFDAADGVFEP